MKISGINKCSFIDFPGHISCVIFLGGCNFSCGYCHNWEIIDFQSAPNIMSVKEALDFLEKRKDRLEGVVISGGEPTISVGLVNFVKSIKSLGFKIKLDTNGTNPKMLEKLLPKLDYVAVDYKCRIEDYGWFVGYRGGGIRESMNLVKDIGEFRTTVCLPYHSEDVIQDMSAEMFPSTPWYFQRYDSKNAKGASYIAPSEKYIEKTVDKLTKIGFNAKKR